MSLLSIPDITLPPAHRQASRADAASGAAAFADAVRREDVVARREDPSPSPRRERAERHDTACGKRAADDGSAPPSAGPAPIAGTTAGAGADASADGVSGNVSSGGGVSGGGTGADAADGSSAPGRSDAVGRGESSGPVARAGTTAVPAQAGAALPDTSMLPDSDAGAAGAPIAADSHAPAEDGVVTAATGPVTDEALAAAGATVLVTDVLAATPTPVVTSAEPFAGADAVGRAATDVRMPAGTGAQSATTAPDVLQTTGPLTTNAESEQPATNTGAALRPAAAPASATAAPASETAVAPASAAATAASESTRTAAEPGMSDAAPTAPVVAAPADARAATASAAPAAAAPVPRHVLLPQLSAPVLSLARAADGEHSVTLTVSPESLGPVTVRAHIAAGVIRLELHAPSEAGREALRAILTDLRRDLAVAAPGSSLAMSSDSSTAGPSADGRQGTGGRSDTGAGSDARTGGDAHTGGHAREERDGLPDRRSSASSPLIRALPPHGGLDLYA